MSNGSRFLTRVALVLCVALVGCNRSSKSSEETAGNVEGRGGDEGGATETPKAGVGKGDGVSTPRPGSVTEADAKALLDRWLAVQNEGDFEAYESLYAKRLEGVRRSGPKEVHLDREGWMKERGRMFKRKMEVELSDIEIDVFAQSALLTFTQRWASGSYEDVGPKQLVLTREGDALRIAREEMLASKLVERETYTQMPEGLFVFDYELDGSIYVVLGPLDNIPTGKRTLLGKDEPTIVTAEIAEKDIPERLTRWREEPLKMGECSVTIGRLVALSRTVPHFGERQVWEATFGENEPYTDQEIADAAFSSYAAYVLGELKAVDEGCSGEGYVRLASVSAPTGPGAPPSADALAAVEEAVRAAFQKLPDYAAEQASFEESGGKGPWIEASSASGIQVHMETRANGKVVQVRVSARAGDGCGEYEGGLAAYYEARVDTSKPKLKLVATSSGYDLEEIVAELDVDGDGTLEYITSDPETGSVLRAWTGETLESFEIAYYDCRC